MLFPVSGVETPIWLPPLVAFAISYFTSMAGISGAFLLLPFQMSYLGFVSPAVSPTNLVFNIVAIPSGIYRFFREKRLVWPLVWTVILGTLPGVFLGGFIRLQYLPDPKPFKLFAGLVLGYIALRMARDLWGKRHDNKSERQAPQPRTGSFLVKTRRFDLRRLEYDFNGQTHGCATGGIFLLALGVGVVGGIYGVGGGAIIAPFFVAVYRLPIYTVAGATLAGTFVTSVAGVAFYQIVAPYYAASGLNAAPDYLLGALFGLGGLAGMYLGARSQKRIPAFWLKLLITLLLIWVSGRYVLGYFF